MKIRTKNLMFSFCLFYLLLLVVLAVLGSAITPDRSPNANEQFLNTALAPINYKTNLLWIKCNGETIDKRTVYSYRKLSPRSVEIVEDLPPKYRYPGWDVPTVLEFPEDIYLERDTRRFVMGTDLLGRSLFSRLVLGIRISLFVGFASILLSAILGLFFGTLSGMGPRWIDNVIMFFINSIWSIPTLLLVFIVLLAVGKGIWNVILAIGLTLWIEIARIVRGQLLKLKQEQFMLYTKTINLPKIKLFIDYILPNIFGPLIVMLSSSFAVAILLEAGLSFLGFGVQPPAPSLGNILAENYGLALSGHYGISIIPCLAIMSVVFVFNIVANHLRDSTDVKF